MINKKADNNIKVNKSLTIKQTKLRGNKMKILTDNTSADDLCEELQEAIDNINEYVNLRDWSFVRLWEDRQAQIVEYIEIHKERLGVE